MADVPPLVLSYCVLAWGVAAFLDLHSTLRQPDMTRYESNRLFSLLRSRMSWAAVPVQLGIELCMIGAVSLLAEDWHEMFGLACACVGAMHVYAWRGNESFRSRKAPENISKRKK